jgi:hypothetical protein
MTKTRAAYHSTKAQAQPESNQAKEEASRATLAVGMLGARPRPPSCRLDPFCAGWSIEWRGWQCRGALGNIPLVTTLAYPI